MLNHPGSTNHWSCTDYKAPSYNEMSFEDALQYIMTPSSILSYDQHYIEPSSEDSNDAYIVYTFKANEDLQKWRDAMHRLFDEYMAMAWKNEK